MITRMCTAGGCSSAHLGPPWRTLQLLWQCVAVMHWSNRAGTASWWPYLPVQLYSTSVATFVASMARLVVPQGMTSGSAHAHSTHVDTLSHSLLHTESLLRSMCWVAVLQAGEPRDTRQQASLASSILTASQVYLDEGNVAEALRFAKAALLAQPNLGRALYQVLGRNVWPWRARCAWCGSISTRHML